MESKMIVKEGATYDYLPHGLVVFVLLGGFSFAIDPILGLLGLLVGIIIIGLRAGIEIDVKNQRVRHYHAILWVRFGKWFDLRNVISGKLVYNRQSSRKQSGIDASAIVGMGGVGASQMGDRKGLIKTYDLMFEEDTGQLEVFHSFTSMKPAFETVKMINDSLNVEVENQLLTMQKVLGKNRRR